MSLIEERIDEDKHFVMIGDFECYENESLEIFLKSFAISYDKDSQGATYLIRNDDAVIAYYTLKCNAIQIQENGIQECVPVIELARLAVHSNYQRQGWGTAIFVNYILPKILTIKNIIAVKAIMVFVEKNDKNAINFYKDKVKFKMPSNKIQNHITEEYSVGCNIMVLNLDNSNEISDRLKTSENS